MKPGDLVKITNRSKSDWKANPLVIISQFGILIEEIEVDNRASLMRGNNPAFVPGWLISSSEEGLVQRATNKILKVKNPVDALPDLITARDLLDKKIREIQELDR